jgi:hypothetical protein
VKNKYFELDDLQGERLKARLYSIRFERMHYMKLRNVKQLCGRLPEDNECFFIETTKSFNAFTFIVYLIKSAGFVEELFIATYSINQRIINSLMRWQESGMIGKIEIRISATIKFRTPGDYARLLKLAEEGRITLTLGWTHKKVSCMNTTAGYFVVEGSGNYGENAMEEQYLFTQNKALYEFRRRIDEIPGSGLGSSG